MTFNHKFGIMLILFGLLLLSMIPALTFGEYAIPIGDVWHFLLAKIQGQEVENKIYDVIIWKLRFPRMLLAIGAGIALAVSGVAYQGCFRNPLVEPYILGVSSGAACGTALAILFPWFFIQMQLSAFGFALLAVSITYMLAYHKGSMSIISLVLSGIIVGAIFSASVGIMKYLAEDVQLREITFWMMGGLHHATWDASLINLVCALICMLILWCLAWPLNLLSLNDEESRSLGINPTRMRCVIIILSTFTAAVCISFTGIIAWIGLMMPHAARMLFGPDHRWVIPASAIMGAIYLLICDTIARNLTGTEIPIGILTSLIGAPYLLFLLRSKGRAFYGM